jgi:hypothetical protein
MCKGNVYERRLEISAVIFGEEKNKLNMPGIESQFLGLQSMAYGMNCLGSVERLEIHKKSPCKSETRTVKVLDVCVGGGMACADRSCVP